MDTATLTLVAGIITCIIGVSSFISSRMSKAEQNGAMEAKLNQAIDGILEIKEQLKESSEEQKHIDLLAHSNSESISHLQHQINEMKITINDTGKTWQALYELLQILKSQKE